MENGKEDHERISLSEANRNQEIEEKFNLHIGKPYRLQIQIYVHDGVMTDCEIDAYQRSFVPLRITLKDGLAYHVADSAEKICFDEFTARRNELTHMAGFGSIIDEEGFARTRDKRKRGEI